MRMINIDKILACQKVDTPKPKPLKKEKKSRTSKARWLEINGTKLYCRSSWEANYAFYLEWLRLQGKVAKWLHEPLRFDFHKIKSGNNSYLPDFQVFNLDGSHEWHEIKGFYDASSKTKIKRFKFYYPDEKFILIDSKAYKQLASQVYRIVPGWE